MPKTQFFSQSSPQLVKQLVKVINYEKQVKQSSPLYSSIIFIIHQSKQVKSTIMKNFNVKNVKMQTWAAIIPLISTCSSFLT